MNTLFARHRTEPPPPAAVITQAPRSNTVASSAFVQFPNGLDYAGALILMVPEGQRLMVDTIGFQGDSPGGRGYGIVTILTRNESMNWIIPALNLNPLAAADSVIGSASLPFPADPCSAVMIRYCRGDGAPKDGVTRIRFSLLGHYVETCPSFA